MKYFVFKFLIGLADKVIDCPLALEDQLSYPPSYLETVGLKLLNDIRALCEKKKKTAYGPFINEE